MRGNGKRSDRPHRTFPFTPSSWPSGSQRPIQLEGCIPRQRASAAGQSRDLHFKTTSPSTSSASIANLCSASADNQKLNSYQSLRITLIAPSPSREPRIPYPSLHPPLAGHNSSIRILSLCSAKAFLNQVHRPWALRQSVWTRLRNPSLRSGQALSRKVELFL